MTIPPLTPIEQGVLEIVGGLIAGALMLVFQIFFAPRCKAHEEGVSA